MSFKLIHGSIFDSKAEAIVIPVHTWYDEHNPGIILRIALSKYDELINKIPKEDLKDFSVRLVEANKKHFVILACFLANHSFNPDYFFDAATKSVNNALELAVKNRIKSIAFPLLMTGHNGGDIKYVVPAMVRVFNNYYDKVDIELFAYSDSEFDEAKGVIKKDDEIANDKKNIKKVVEELISIISDNGFSEAVKKYDKHELEMISSLNLNMMFCFNSLIKSNFLMLDDHYSDIYDKAKEVNKIKEKDDLISKFIEKQLKLAVCLLGLTLLAQYNDLKNTYDDFREKVNDVFYNKYARD